ncbi:hypothetical protein KIPB_016798, partial [Kipferlia bialata]|eukprot:g16798.t1
MPPDPTPLYILRCFEPRPARGIFCLCKDGKCKKSYGRGSTRSIVKHLLGCHADELTD